jgi:SAM-dependent methyltransferase
MPTSSPVGDTEPLPTRREVFKLFLAEKTDPEPFYTQLARRSMADFPFETEGKLVLDLGAGPGYYSRALERRGATMVAIDLDPADLTSAAGPAPGAVACDGGRLPFPDGTFDGVFCSNMLEHTPEPERIFDDAARVLKPGGWAWISWTNWYSPWGGHNIVPLHFLGPHLGYRAWCRLFGEPPKNIPYEGLFPTYVGKMLRVARQHPTLELLDAVPRYYPSQRWILSVPGVREVATWNCLLLMRRRPLVPIGA